MSEESDQNFITVCMLICHCLIMIIHSFTLINVISAYSVIKCYVPPLKATIFYDDYYLKIDRSRANLNEGYECPRSIDDIVKQLNQRRSDQEAAGNNWHGGGSRMSSFKKTINAEIHHKQSSPLIIYDEIPNRLDDSSDEVESLC